MSEPLKISLAQINPTVGDIEGNLALICRYRQLAADEGCNLVVFPEFCLTGYPPEDLVLKPAFQTSVDRALARLAEETRDGGPGVIVSGPKPDGDKLYNAAFLIADGKILGSRFKHHLPNYGVFDEKRLFDEALLPDPI